MRYEITNLEDDTIFETENLRTALAFTARWAKENPEEYRAILHDHTTQQLFSLVLKNGRIQKIHHYLHESHLPAERYHTLINQNLETLERAAKSLGYDPIIEWNQIEGFPSLKTSQFHKKRLARLIELKAPKIIIKREQEAVKEAEEEEEEHRLG